MRVRNGCTFVCVCVWLWACGWGVGICVLLILGVEVRIYGVVEGWSRHLSHGQQNDHEFLLAIGKGERVTLSVTLPNLSSTRTRGHFLGRGSQMAAPTLHSNTLSSHYFPTTQTHTHVHAHTRARTYMHAHTRTHIYTRMHARTPAHTLTHMHARKHTHPRTRTHTSTHACTRARTHAPRRRKWRSAASWTSWPSLCPCAMTCCS